MENGVVVSLDARRASASASGTEVSHVSKMDSVHALQYGLELPTMGKDNKGRDIHQPFVLARGKSLVEGIDSICICQALTSTWGGPKFSNSKSGNVLTAFRDSSVQFENNLNVRYRFAFVKVGDKATTEAIEKALAESPVYIKNYYSNNIMDVLTDEQIQMIANDKLDINTVANKLLLRDKDNNVILDANDDKVYRQSFAIGSYEDDFVTVAWKKGGKGLSIDKAIEIASKKAKELVA